VTLRPKASNLFQLLDAYFFELRLPDLISHSSWRALGL